MNLQTDDGFILFRSSFVPPCPALWLLRSVRRFLSVPSVSRTDDVLLFEAVADQLHANGQSLAVRSAGNADARKSCQVDRNRINIAQIHLKRIA